MEITAAPRGKTSRTLSWRTGRTLGVHGSLVAAIPNAYAHGQPGLTAGLPDLMVLSPQLGGFTGYIELKRSPRARLSVQQRILREFLLERGVPYAVCCGRDEPIRVLEEWGAVRKAENSRGA